MTYSTIDALRESLARPTPKQRTAAYIDKMIHAVPAMTTVDRNVFILERCTKRRVLELGASGLLADQIQKMASEYQGIDRTARDRVVAFDLDVVDGCPALPVTIEPEWIVCGEILEHLSNPGWVLARLRRQCPTVPLIISVPNAFSGIALAHLEQDGIENVNIDHVSWYSYRTLRTLLERYGYQIAEGHWYHGDPLTAEGLLVVTT